MATPKAKRSPFEVKLSPVELDELARKLSIEIEYAQTARDRVIGDQASVERAYRKYEGGKGISKNTPWQGASNLGSPIVTEKVDAMRARMVDTFFTDPIWNVEGYGASAERAAFVESYHQWKAEIAGLQKALSRVVHVALIEGTGILEVTDRVELRKGVRRARVLVQRDETSGLPVLDETGNPTPAVRANGKFEEAEPGEPYVLAIVSDVVRATTGPSFRVHGLRDFLVLPGHAAEKADVWGYAKRFYRRLPELQKREEQGFYKGVADLGEAGEREANATDRSAGQDIAVQHGETAEKEIWEVNYLADLDNDGFEEWYVCTLSVLHRKILRIQYQDYNTPHYVLFAPFPRPFSLYGYSYAEDKLGSLYDEHAALRNIYADRSVLATSAPILLMENSSWNPALKPFGPRQVIPVRDMNEIKQLEIRDVPNSVQAQQNLVLQFAERLSGQNDTTTGVMAQQDRTLGEVKLTTEQSYIRINEIIKNCQEPMEELFHILHHIYVSALEDNEAPESAPGDLMQMMAERGVKMPSHQIRADDLIGTFRGRPKNSVEGTDFNRMKADFAQLLTALTQMSQGNPALAMHLQQPNVIRSILSQLARIHRWPDRHNLVSSFTGQPPMPPPMPGLPPGAPLPPGGNGAPVAGPPPPPVG